MYAILYPITALSQAELTRNDKEKVNFDAVYFPLVFLERNDQVNK